jgi:hypothetical protein
VWAQVAVVVAAVALSQLVVLLGARAAGVQFTAPSSYARWDSANYLSIANHGYTLERCPADGLFARKGDWCGNTQWMPGYPLLIRAATALGLGSLGEIVVLTRLLHVAMLAACWMLLLRDRRPSAAVLALLIAAVFPGMIYLDGIFPIATAILAVVVAIALLERRRWILAGVAAGLALLCYEVAGFLAIGGVFGILTVRGLRLSERVRASALFLAPIAAAGVTLLIVFQVYTGRVNAFLLAQPSYHRLTPWAGLWHRLSTPVMPLYPGSVRTSWPSVQSGVLAVLVLSCLTAVAVRWRDRDARDVYTAGYVGALWIVTLTIGAPHPWYRGELLALPVVALTVRLPRVVQVAAVVVFAVVAVHMAARFFDWTLV